MTPQKTCQNNTFSLVPVGVRAWLQGTFLHVLEWYINPPDFMHEGETVSRLLWSTQSYQARNPAGFCILPGKHLHSPGKYRWVSPALKLKAAAWKQMCPFPIKHFIVPQWLSLRDLLPHSILSPHVSYDKSQLCSHSGANSLNEWANEWIMFIVPQLGNCSVTAPYIEEENKLKKNFWVNKDKIWLTYIFTITMNCTWTFHMNELLHIAKANAALFSFVIIGMLRYTGGWLWGE